MNLRIARLSYLLQGIPNFEGFFLVSFFPFVFAISSFGERIGSIMIRKKKKKKEKDCILSLICFSLFRISTLSLFLRSFPHTSNQNFVPPCFTEVQISQESRLGHSLARLLVRSLVRLVAFSLTHLKLVEKWMIRCLATTWFCPTVLCFTVV